VLAFVDHGAEGTGEPLAALLREGRANANNAADQIVLVDAALAQLPEQVRGRVLVRGDAAAGMQALLHHLSTRGLQYSVGVNARQPVVDALAALPRQCWRQAIDADGTARDGAQVAELTGHLPATYTGWPAGMRVIARRERPHPGAQLRLTDHDGWRITVFATNTAGGRIPELELRHRQRARAEDRIRGLKDSGLRNLPLHEFAKNVIWLELVASPPSYSAGPRPWRSPAPPPEPGNPNGSGCGCCTWPAGSSPPAADTGCDYPAAGHGPTSSSADTPACTPCLDTRPSSRPDPTENRRPQRRSALAPRTGNTTPASTRTRQIKITKDRG
jgi:hypothetical protein